MKERIIDRAVEMFTEQGVRSIRMDDIATDMSISKRTIYEIFGDKEQLIIECLNRVDELHEERRKEIAERGGNIIDTLLLAMDEFEPNDSGELFISSLKKFYPRIYNDLINKGLRGGYILLRKELQKGVKEGYIVSGINLDLATMMFIHSIYGLFEGNFILYPANISKTEAARHIITYYFRGIATEKGIKAIDEYINKKKQ